MMTKTSLNDCMLPIFHYDKIFRWMDGWVEGWIDEWIDGQKMDGYIFGLKFHFIN